LIPSWRVSRPGATVENHASRLPAGRSTDTSFYIEPLGFTKTDFDDGMELSWPISAKDMLKLEGKTPVLMFGDPIDGPNNSDPLELTREEIVEIYRFVREDVAPQFAPFLA
jgi:hypothetical protein